MRDVQDPAGRPTRAILDAADDAGDRRRRRRRAASRAPAACWSSSTPADNNLVTFRFKNADVKMLAAEEDFELGGHKFRAGAIIVPERRSRAARADAEGARAVGVGGRVGAGGEDARPRRAAHRLHPQLDAHAGRGLGGARRSTPTACRTPTSPIRSCARATCARSTTSSSFRTSAAARVSQVNGMPKTGDGAAAVQEDRRDAEPRRSSIRATTSAAAWASKGCVELAKFVQEGGTLITEGSTATIFPEYGITTGVTVEEPAQLFVRGSILRGMIADTKSPIAYGYDGTRSAGLLQPGAGAERGGGGFGGFGGGRGGAPGPARTPASARTSRRTPRRCASQPFEADSNAAPPGRGDAAAAPTTWRSCGRWRSSSASPIDDTRPRVVMQFPPNPNDMLLSGTLRQRPVPRRTAPRRSISRSARATS